MGLQTYITLTPDNATSAPHQSDSAVVLKKVIKLQFLKPVLLPPSPLSKNSVLETSFKKLIKVEFFFLKILLNSLMALYQVLSVHKVVFGSSEYKNK